MLCLGLDPDDPGTVAQLEEKCLRLIEATAEFVCAVKPNMAFFEQHGSPGYAVLERLRDELPVGRLLILDAKRGDVGNTAAAYARGLFDTLGADAVTVNPLMGHDSVSPYLDRPGRGVFLLARTSNPGAADFLERPLGDGRLLYESIVDEAASWAPPGTIGFVVGATSPGAVTAVRRRAPDAPLLLPGAGAQGGDLAGAVRAAVGGRRGNAIVPISRGISGAPDGAAGAARRFRDEIAAAAGPAA